LVGLVLAIDGPSSGIDGLRYRPFINLHQTATQWPAVHTDEGPVEHCPLGRFRSL